MSAQTPEDHGITKGAGKKGKGGKGREPVEVKFTVEPDGSLRVYYPKEKSPIAVLGIVAAGTCILEDELLGRKPRQEGLVQVARGLPGSRP